MIAWGKKSDGSDDVAVFTGIADWDGSHLTMRGPAEGTSFTLPDEWLDRIKLVSAGSKDTLVGAEYCFSVRIGPLPEGADTAEYLKTDLKWPAEPGAS